VRAKAWHQIVNKGKVPCHIIEIQYGEETTEDDIERLEYYDGE
jgi:mannose-6-phosphate isomerase-like protein (cupin superfamily)